MTLRIKSPLRSAEGILRCGASKWRVFLVGSTPPFWTLQVQKRKTSHRVPTCSLRNTAYCWRSATRFLCGQYPHSLGYFPMQRALNSSLLPPPRPPFSRRRLCICGGSYHISDDTAAVFFGWLLLTSARSEPRSTSCQDGTKRGGRKQKRPVLLHTGYG